MSEMEILKQEIEALKAAKAMAEDAALSNVAKIRALEIQVDDLRSQLEQRG